MSKADCETCYIDYNDSTFKCDSCVAEKYLSDDSCLDSCPNSYLFIILFNNNNFRSMQLEFCLQK